MAKKKIYFGTNTKMYKTIKDTVEFVSQLQELTKDISREDMQLFVIPSYTTLRDANEEKDEDLLMVGAQNMGWEEQGQFTGEISPLMLQEVGTDIVMIGHSERRHVLGETDEEENKKVLCALNHNFTTLLCVGETGEQKDYGISEEVIRCSPSEISFTRILRPVRIFFRCRIHKEQKQEKRTAGCGIFSPVFHIIQRMQKKVRRADHAEIPKSAARSSAASGCDNGGYSVCRAGTV